MLRGFLDLAVLRHDGFASGLGLLLAHKLAEYSMLAERLGEIARAAMAGDPAICKRRSKNPSLKRPVSPVAPE
jgi:Serine acetyltransferase, N-terminal